jgi:hypothetical protein
VEEHLDEHEGRDGLRVAPELGEMGDLRGHPSVSREEGERAGVEGPYGEPPYLVVNVALYEVVGCGSEGNFEEQPAFGAAPSPC